MTRARRASGALGAALAALLTGCGGPAGPGVAWEARCPTDTLAAGDPFTVQLRGAWPRAAGAAHLRWGVGDSLLVLGIDSTRARAGDGREGRVYRARLAAPRAGRVRVPPAALVAASGETLALSLPARVRVGSRLPTTGEADLRPLAPLVSLRGFPWMWIVAAGALLAAAAAALWLRRRRRRRAAAEEPPPPPPGIEFEAALRALAARELPERGEMRAFAQELSWILRRYLGRRWERPGSAATRPEIVSWLPRTRLCVREQGRIAAWLEEADRIKFAGHRPPLADARALAEGASAIVRRTEELFEPPPSDEAAAAEGGPAPGGGT